MSHETMKPAYEQWKAKLLRRVARDLHSPSVPTPANLFSAYKPPGTWEFMSLSRLKDPTKDIEIADELESMLNVLLYYSIRYLPHTCLDVGEFVHKYFDGAVPVDRHSHKYTTGVFRRLFISGGGMIAQDFSDLVFLRAPLRALPAGTPSPAAPSRDDPFRQDTPTPRSEDHPKAALPVINLRRDSISQEDVHPIDTILGELFPLFKALYDLPNARHRWRRAGPDDSHSDADSAARLNAMNTKASPEQLRTRFRERKTSRSARTLQLRRLEEIAGMLKDHSAMREFLDCALHELSRPADDKQADRLYAPFSADKDAEDEE